MLIVDPGSEPQIIQNFIDDARLDPIAIVNTHGHFDHVGAVDSIMKTYKIPFLLSNGDAKLLKQANIYQRLFQGSNPIPIPEITTPIGTSNSDLKIGPFSLRVIATPGHTKGSVCLIIGKQMFSGDTILAGGFGRTVLPGGDPKAMSQSAAALRDLDGSLTVWPGHGKSFPLYSLLARIDSVG